MEWSTVIFWLVIVFVVLYVISIDNRLVTMRNRFKNAFAQIEVQLKRRYDLIPNLVETAKGYLSHERETLEEVIAARNEALTGLNAAASNPSSQTAMDELVNAEKHLTSALGKLSVVVEAYPELKASENMQQLSEEMTSTENRVAFARQSFNDSVMAYNTYKQSFPPVALAGLFGHGKDALLLEFADSADIQQAPKVSF